MRAKISFEIDLHDQVLDVAGMCASDWINILRMGEEDGLIAVLSHTVEVAPVVPIKYVSKTVQLEDDHAEVSRAGGEGRTGGGPSST